jgi:hypothetical protein
MVIDGYVFDFLKALKQKMRQAYHRAGASWFSNRHYQ